MVSTVQPRWTAPSRVSATTPTNERPNRASADTCQRQTGVLHLDPVPVPIPVYVVEDLATHQPEVLAACTEVATPRSCVSATAEEAEARIMAGSAQHTYRVEVWRGGEWLSRQLVFSEIDAPAERARSLGMTVGVLAVGESQTAPTSDAGTASPIPQRDTVPDAQQPAPPEGPDQSAEPPTPAVIVRLEVAGRIGSGINHPRVGAGASMAVIPLGLPLGLFLTGTWLSSSSVDVDVTSRWLSGGGGVVAVIAATDELLLDGRLAYLREQWRVVAAETNQMSEETATRTYNALDLEVGAAVRLIDPLHVRLGVGLRTTPAQQVRVADRNLGDNPSPAPCASLGVLLRF